jgi:hypothetical protein
MRADRTQTLAPTADPHAGRKKGFAMRRLQWVALISLGMALACAATAEARGPRFFFGVNLTPGFYGGYGYGPYGYYPGYYPPYYGYGYRPYPPPPPVVIQAPPVVMQAPPVVVTQQPAQTVLTPPMIAPNLLAPAQPPAPAPFVAPQTNYYNYPSGNYYYPY